MDVEQGSARRAVASLALGAAGMMAASLAAAQTPACDQLKVTLANRLSGGPGSVTLDALPASAAVPRGAKVIGNCEGGAWKIVFRRGTGLPPLVVEPASAPVAAPAPPAPQPAPSPVPPVSPAAPAPAPPPVRVPVLQPVAKPAAPAAIDTAPADTAGRPRANVDAPAEAPAAPPASAPTVETGDQDEGQAPRASRRWAWLPALLIVPLLGWAGAWALRRRHYDAAGLPRGPRL